MKSALLAIVAATALVAVAAIETSHAHHPPISEIVWPDSHAGYDYFNNHTLWPTDIYKPILFDHWDADHTYFYQATADYRYIADKNGDWDGRVHSTIHVGELDPHVEHTFIYMINEDGEDVFIAVPYQVVDELDITYHISDSGHHAAQVILVYLSPFYDALDIYYYYHHVNASDYQALFDQNRWILQREPYANMTADAITDHTRFNDLIQKHDRIESKYDRVYKKYLRAVDDANALQDELVQLQKRQTTIENNARIAYWQSVVKSPAGIYLTVISPDTYIDRFEDSVNDRPRPAYVEAPSQ